MCSNDPQKSYTLLSDLISAAFDECFPLKTVKLGYKTRKSWLSDRHKKAIRIKNNLYHKKQKSQNDEDILLYKRFRNQLNWELRKAEKQYYDNLLIENKSNRHRPYKKDWPQLK